jgi:hypothetical protein
MKKYLILLVFILVQTSQAQQQIIPLNSDYDNLMENDNYIKDINGDLDKFVGTWKWVDPSNPNTYLEIVFIKFINYKLAHYAKFYMDQIVGNYKYVENGVLIVDTLNNFDTTMHSPNSPVMLTVPIKPLFKEFIIIIRDVIKHKDGKAFFDIIDLNATPLKATWRLRDSEGIKTAPVPEGFSIPTNVILTKQ